MGNKTTKTVKVSEDTAEQWNQYVEETPEVDSVSHLIRLSVQKEMSGEYDVEQRRSSDESAGASGEVLTHLRKIQTSIDDVEERLTALEETESAEAEYDIQKATYNALPTAPKPVEDAGLEEPTMQELARVGGQKTQPQEWAATVEEIARQLGAEPGDVEDALDRLRETTGQVRRVVGGPENTAYYWKKGQ